MIVAERKDFYAGKSAVGLHETHDQVNLIALNFAPMVYHYQTPLVQMVNLASIADDFMRKAKQNHPLNVLLGMLSWSFTD